MQKLPAPVLIQAMKEEAAIRKRRPGLAVFDRFIVPNSNSAAPTAAIDPGLWNGTARPESLTGLVREATYADRD
jgi:hypothetical protein